MGSSDDGSENDNLLDNESEESDELAASDSDESSSGNDESAESDVDDEDDDDDAQEESKTDKIVKQIHNKYDQLKGTRLYVRFPKKLPLDKKEFDLMVKSLSPLIIEAHKPRQKHARFCLVDFKSKEDRDTAMTDIKEAIKTNEKFKGIVVSLPRTESDEFVNTLVERKQKSVEDKRTKALMKRAAKKAQKKESYTSSIVITNLPKTTSIAEVRKLFPNAVDVQIKPGRGIFQEFGVATVTMPSTYDARIAVKKDLSISGTKLFVRFNIKHKRPRRPNTNRKRKSDLEEKPALKTKKLKN